MQITKKSYTFEVTEHKGMFTTPSNEDFELIKKFLKSEEITAEHIFVYPIRLCDTATDRDNEQFSLLALESIKTMIVGKAGIKNHDWNSNNIHSRIYKAEIEEIDGVMCLVGYAYTMDTEGNRELIEGIKSGLLQEVSIGFNATSYTMLESGVRQIDDVDDVYEWSFVAVPAQRQAGVIKSYEDNKDKEGVKDMTLEELQARVKELEAEVAIKSARVKELEEEKVQTVLENAIASALDGLEFANEKAEEIARQIAESGIKVSEDGVEGVDEVKTTLSEDYKFLFKSEEVNGEGGEKQLDEGKEDEVKSKSFTYIPEKVTKKSANKIDFTYMPNKTK